MSLESVHHNYLVEVAYTSLLHPTEPDRLVQINFGRILSENGIQGAFNWLDCVYTIEMNAYDQYRVKENKPTTNHSSKFKCRIYLHN